MTTAVTRGHRPPRCAEPDRLARVRHHPGRSITTCNDQRHGHLRTNDFFDAPSFPTITLEFDISAVKSA